MKRSLLEIALKIYKTTSIYILRTKKIEWIRKYGFCDGFSPVDVGGLLTGHSVDAIKQELGAGTQNNDINNVLSFLVIESEPRLPTNAQ